MSIILDSISNTNEWRFADAGWGIPTTNGKPYRSALTSAHDADREIMEHYNYQDDEPRELNFD